MDAIVYIHLASRCRRFCVKSRVWLCFGNEIGVVFVISDNNTRWSYVWPRVCILKSIFSYLFFNSDFNSRFKLNWRMLPSCNLLPKTSNTSSKLVATAFSCGHIHSLTMNGDQVKCSSCNEKHPNTVSMNRIVSLVFNDICETTNPHFPSLGGARSIRW